MSVSAWKGAIYNDDLVWERLANGNIGSISFSGVEPFIYAAKRVKPRNIDEVAVLLSISKLMIHFEDEYEILLQTLGNRRMDGPFPELKETYGYPIYREQIFDLIRIHLTDDEEQVYVLADGIAKRLNTAKDQLFSMYYIDEYVLDNIWKYTPRTGSKRFYTHFATLIYEACWVLCNGSSEYYKENPVVIGIPQKQYRI